jgi:hypothetical protein
MVTLAQVRNETRGKSALFAKPYLLDGVVMLSGAISRERFQNHPGHR